MATHLYHAHFGLNESPFGITPNPAFFYSGNTRGEILDALIHALVHGEGIVKVSGEVGSGKTMLCRMLESQLPSNIDVIYLVNPSLSPAEVVYAIAAELAIDTSGRRTDEVLRALHGLLIERHAAGRQVVLLVEEAQAMPLETLEEIRLLTNLETAHHKLLQIVLFGQPELDASLDLPGMRQLKERITESFEVPPMAPGLIGEFLAFRLRTAGYHGPVLFRQDAVRLIAGVSKGIVRRINILADKALIAAFTDNADTVTGKHVRAAIADSAFGRPRLFARREALVLAALLAACIALAAWFLLAGAPIRPAQAARPRPRPLLSAAAPGDTATGPLQRCLAESAVWLNSRPDHNLALQIMLMPAADRDGIERFLRNTGAAIGMAKVHAYPLRIDQTVYIAIVYGDFQTLDEAQAVQKGLLRAGASGAELRDIKTMREQMLQAHQNIG